MNGMIVYDRQVAKNRKWYIGQYIEGFKSYGHDCRLVFSDELDEARKSLLSKQAFTDNKKIDSLLGVDFVIMRDIRPDLSAWLEEKGIRVFNSARVSSICNDKYASYKLMEEAGSVNYLPVIRLEEYKNYRDEWEFPCVMKSVDGHGGTEVYWIDDENALNAMTDIEAGRYILQKACNNPGIDVRVYVLGGQIVAAMKRMSRLSEDIHESFRSNYCLGGSCSIYNIEDNPGMHEAVENIIKLLKPDFVGIDFIFNDNKAVFNEVEDVVGARMLYDHTDIDIVDLYVEYIIAEL